VTAPELFGVSFRLVFDPEKVRFVEMQTPLSGLAAVAAAKEVRPGELWGVVGARGATTQGSPADHLWATLRFEALSEGSSQMTLVGNHSLAMSLRGEAVPLAWGGVTIIHGP
jgi:hypothetical protein